MTDEKEDPRQCCSLCEKPKGEGKMIAGETGALICVTCVNAARKALKRDDYKNGDHPMPITKPVKWAWSSGNVISIYEPNDSVDGGRIFLALPISAFDGRKQIEKTAQFVCDAINTVLRLDAAMQEGLSADPRTDADGGSTPPSPEPEPEAG